MFQAERQNRFHDRSKLLMNKYAKLLEGIENPYTKAVTAVLMENETEWLNSLDESVRLVNVGSFDKYVYPLVRRTYPTLMVNDIVSVQPMTGPQGLIFYLKFNYGTSKGGITAGDEYLGGNTAGFDQSYSSDTITNELVGTGDGATAIYNAHIAAFLPIQPGTVRIATNTAVVGDVVVVDDGLGNLAGTGLTSGTINYTTGAVNLTFANNVTLNAKILMTYRYNNEANTNIPELDMDISKISVLAQTRKLRTKWSPEAAQDLKNLHGLDAEVELVTIISQQLALETNHEVVNDLYTNSSFNTNWSATALPGVSYREHKDTYIDSLVACSNQIYAQTLRGEANFQVASTEVSTIIETLPGFVPAPSNAVRGIGFIGTLNSRWNIFKDPFLPANKSVVGYKGDSFLDTGYVYSPYVPLIATPTIQNADDFVNRKGLLSRYSKSVINNKFYATFSKVA